MNDLETEARQALIHLYDPAFLRKSPLLGVLGLQGKPGAAEALRMALEAAIDRLKPASGCPAYTRGRLYYQVLFYRYVQQFGQADVARQLGVSARHLRRLQVEAIEALVDQLAADFQTVETPASGQVAPAGAKTGAPSLAADAPPQMPPNALEGEAPWWGDSLSGQATRVEGLLREVLSLAANLAAQYGVSLEIQASEGMPLAVAPPALLKQLVLNLLGAAIPSVSRGAVGWRVAAGPGQIVMRLEARACGPDDSPQWDPACLEMTRELAGLCGAALNIVAEGPRLVADVRLASTEQITVLAIEDNADTLHLWERYVQDTRYHLQAAQDPEQALELAIRGAPAIIILDLMMPGVDGWTLLSHLRHHPTTATTRVVVCTVLPQRELALSLGAADFMRKPVTRRQFLEVLERQSEAATSR